MTLDILAICAHPDDAELHCAGLMLMAQQHGARIGVVDLTRGEAASRGTPAIRAQEAAAAAAILNLTLRDNLGLPDAQLQLCPAHLLPVIECIRQHRPKLVLTSHWDDHHPDHSATSQLVRQACYLAGIGNYPATGSPHRPEQVLYYLDRLAHVPHLVQDISAVFAQKLAAVKCYASQLHASGSTQTATPIAASDYLEHWAARQRHYGALIGVSHGEAYVLRSPVPLNNPLDLVWGRQGLV